MTVRDARADWRGFAAGSIPSKAATPRLDAFLDGIRRSAAASSRLTLLDVGCGTGGLARRWFEGGFSVVGVDINPEAVRIAREHSASAADAGRTLRYDEADFSSPRSPRIDGGPFDVVVCQLVLSIIGDRPRRASLLRNIHANLHPGGRCYLSASGVSDSINAGYAALYAADRHLTGEEHTYFSRDGQGTVLYTTHHFTAEELMASLVAAGFREVEIATEREASSRRPEEAAFFHYVTCRRG